MAKRIIDYQKLVENYDMMIETLEYDSQRSGGKAKLNASVLASMHELRDRYAKKFVKPAPVKGGNQK
jgi:hypothetical protein